MYQIDNSSTVSVPPTSTAAGTPGFFTDGNPATGIPATILPAEWLNTVQMELINAILASGQTLSKTSFNQLAQAIQQASGTFALDTGTANHYVCLPAQALSLRREGQLLRFKVKQANTGASTLNDGLGEAPLLSMAYTPLAGGEMAAGSHVWAIWLGGVGASGAYVMYAATGGAFPVGNALHDQHALTLGQANQLFATQESVNRNFPAQWDTRMTQRFTFTY